VQCFLLPFLSVHAAMPQNKQKKLKPSAAKLKTKMLAARRKTAANRFTPIQQNAPENTSILIRPSALKSTKVRRKIAKNNLLFSIRSRSNERLFCLRSSFIASFNDEVTAKQNGRSISEMNLPL
jgi:hypothetical protein